MAVIVPAPVCLFVYKRLAPLKNLIASLQQNALALATDIHIFSDAANNAADEESVDSVRKFITGLRGFKSVAVYLSGSNNGLAKSIINGVTQIIAERGKVIVLEDDLQVAPNFLDFMNGALATFETNQKVFAISGYSSPVTAGQNQDIYFTRRSSSWGWATWSDRWEKIDWNVSDFEQFNKDSRQQKGFNEMGSDLTHMLRKQMTGRLNSWAIRWVYHQFKHDLYTVFPVISKVCNNGFHEGASNTYKNTESRFATVLDQTGKKDFNFLLQPSLDKNILKQFLQPYSMKTRVISKLKALLQF